MREYWIDIGGIPHSVQLTDAEAKRLGVADKVVTRSVKPPANKSRSHTRSKEA